MQLPAKYQQTQGCDGMHGLDLLCQALHWARLDFPEPNVTDKCDGESQMFIRATLSLKA